MLELRLRFGKIEKRKSDYNTRAELDRQYKATWADAAPKLDKVFGNDNLKGGRETPTERGQQSGSQGSTFRGDGKPAVVRRAGDKLKMVWVAAFAGGGLDDGPVEGGERDKSRQEKRAEARREAKAGEKDGKRTKGWLFGVGSIHIFRSISTERISLIWACCRLRNEAEIPQHESGLGLS